MEKIEDLVKRQESKGKENITSEEVKKLVKLYLQGNDPKKEGEGRYLYYNNDEFKGIERWKRI